VIFQLDRLIVAGFLTIAAVTFYSVPLSIAQRFVIVQAIFATAFFPAATELHAQGDRERLRDAYLSSMKLVLVMVIPMIVLVAMFSHPLLSAWAWHQLRRRERRHPCRPRGRLTGWPRYRGGRRWRRTRPATSAGARALPSSAPRSTCP